MVNTKYCPQCESTKSIDDFSFKSKRLGTLYYVCKICQRRNARLYYIENINKVKLQQKKYIEKNPGVRKALYEKNKKYYLLQKKEYYKKHSEEIKEKSRETYRANPSIRANQKQLIYYNISLAQKQQILHQQGGVCAICGTNDFGKRGPHTDHCHANKIVRGVLCSNCNRGIGCFKDNICIMSKAIEYLKKHLHLDAR